MLEENAEFDKWFNGFNEGDVFGLEHYWERDMQLAFEAGYAAAQTTKQDKSTNEE